MRTNYERERAKWVRGMEEVEANAPDPCFLPPSVYLQYVNGCLYFGVQASPKFRVLKSMATGAEPE